MVLQHRTRRRDTRCGGGSPVTGSLWQWQLLSGAQTGPTQQARGRPRGSWRAWHVIINLEAQQASQPLQRPKTS